MTDYVEMKDKDLVVAVRSMHDGMKIALTALKRGGMGEGGGYSQEQVADFCLRHLREVEHNLRWLEDNV